MVFISSTEGRLVEIRAVSPIELKDVEFFQHEMRSVLAASLERKIVFANVSALTILAGEHAEALIRLMRSDNPQIERSAIYLPGDKPSRDLQFDRVIQAASNPSRRLFHSADVLEEWLGQVLNAGEKRRLHLVLQGILQEDTPTV